jgi:hypothetical protein
MASAQEQATITLAAGADLSASQYCFVKLNSSGLVVLCGAGEAAIGILQNDPDASGKAATVAISGVSKIVAGGSITRGVRVASDGSGKAKTAVAGSVNTSNSGTAADAVVASFTMGHILDTGVTDNIARMLLQPLGAVPTTTS